MKSNKGVLFRLSGVVVHGLHYGKKLGFPTANIELAKAETELVRTKSGVYAGRAVVNATNKTYKAGIVIEQVDSTEPPKVEAHLLGFSGDLYGQSISIELMTLLRPFKSFKTERELKAQIEKDLKKVEKMIFLR